MAITKVYAVRNHLNRIVDYAANEEKTSLDNIIDYATNPQKTEQRLFESAINCSSVDSAHDEMMMTKRKFQKNGKVLAYHFIQSFAPGEVTPEEAHTIGVEFAKECFGDRFEVVVGTHLDKKHLHNHIVVNSVSFVDGKKFRSNPQTYYNIIRKTSDRLCKEHNLSVIDAPSNKGKHYAEWKAENEGRPTIRGQMREELDEIIKHSYTMKDFWRKLNANGYVIHRKGENIKYTSIVPPFGKRSIRLDSLGKDYTEEAIQQRITAARNGIHIMSPSMVQRVYKVKGSVKSYRRKKLTGFQALYFKYLYLFKKIRRHKAQKTVSFFMRTELTKMQRYQKQFHFLYDKGIITNAQLQQHMQEQENKISLLTNQRVKLYGEKKHTNVESISSEISNINTELAKCRKEVRTCKAIFKDVEIITEKQKELQRVLETEKHKGKEEVKNNGNKRRSR